MVEFLGVVFVMLFVGLIVWMIRFLGSIVSKKTPDTLGYDE
jgi:Na+-transporting methylmalonyl-CoA/oxaloacetate decarboxylase gamma subunit